MKSLMKFFVPVFLLVFTMGISAQPGPGKSKGKAVIADKLNLTADQEKKIEDLRTNHQKKMIDLRADMAKLHLEKKELLNKGNYDRKSFLALEEKIMKQRNAIEIARANQQMDVYEVLDATQKELWNKHPMKNGMQMQGKGFRGSKDCPNNCEPGRKQKGQSSHRGM